MTATERLTKYVEYKGISLREFYSKTGLPNGFLTKSKSFGIDNLEGIHSNFPELNIYWVLFEEGEMIIEPGKDIVAAGSDAYVKGKNLKIRSLAIVTDKKNEEIIKLVPVLAHAGYLDNITDPEYIRELPTLSVTGFLPQGSYRGFEVHGDSMEPTFYPGDRVICRYVEDWTKLQSNTCYVIVCKHRGIILKRVKNAIAKEGKLYMISDNIDYDPYALELNEIFEVWEFKLLLRITIKSGRSIEQRVTDIEKFMKGDK